MSKAAFRRSSSATGPNEPTSEPTSAPPSPSAPARFVTAFARVRPLLKAEANKVPDYWPVPRPALITTSFEPLDDDAKAAMAMSGAQAQRDADQITPSSGVGREMVVVLDPDKKFTRKKAGAFAFRRVFASSNLNEYEDPPVRPLPVTAATEVFGEIRPILESTCARRNSAVIVCGGAKSGKMTTMFGDMSGTDQESRGILPRYAMEIFRALQTNKAPNADLTTAIEFLEVSGDTITDLLMPVAERATSLPIKLKDEGHSLVTLVGARLVAVSDGPMMLSQLKAGLRTARKKDPHSHLLVNFRVTEKADFEHPDDSTQRVTKVSRYWAQFVLVSGVPTAFQRCIDIAVQRDSSHGTALKVPVRDSMVTRVSAEAYGGNCDTYCVVCVSPFFGHVKDSFMALETVAKFGKVKTRAVVSADSQTSQFRRLHDEMSGVSTEIKQTTEAQDLVQNELNERQERVEAAAASLEAQRTIQAEAEKRYTANELVKIVKALRLLRLRRQGDAKRKSLELELAAADEALKKSLSNVVSVSQVNEDMAESIDNVRTGRAEIERGKAAAEDRMQEIRAKQDELDVLRRDPAEIKAQVRREHEAAMAKLAEKRGAGQTALDDAEKELAFAEKENVAAKKELVELEGPEKRAAAAKKQNEELTHEKELLEKDIQLLEYEIAKVEAELNKPEGGCKCVIQ